MVVGLAALGVARSMAERSVVAKKKRRKEGVRRRRRRGRRGRRREKSEAHNKRDDGKVRGDDGDVYSQTSHLHRRVRVARGVSKRVGVVRGDEYGRWVFFFFEE
jgi:hypothetical protein